MCTRGITRREVLAGMATTALIARRASAFEGSGAGDAGSYREVADGAMRWLARHAVTTPAGVTWPADPANPSAQLANLYSGSAGVVLFMAEHAAVSRDTTSRDLTLRGAKHLADAVGTATRQRAAGAKTQFDAEGAGLYTGLAGVAWVLEQAYRVTNDPSLRQGATSAIDLLIELAQLDGETARWSESTDIISGNAGIGLVLLWAAKSLGAELATPLAARAGRSLIASGTPLSGGLTWAISPRVPRRYPNFSHGAGGVSYYLASLYQATKDEAFLDAAKKGAAYLQSVATPTPGGGKMVFHSEGNEQLYYLSWCHGPSGTARLFHKLDEITRDRAYQRWAHQLNTATQDMKVPERSPGFWNNISQCCGNCGVVEHFVAMHDHTGDSRHLTYARVVADDVLARATGDGDGFKWTQAEHRVRPELLQAQTGFMQGAAGVGMALLHLDGAMNRRKPFVVLPDSPYFG